MTTVREAGRMSTSQQKHTAQPHPPRRLRSLMRSRPVQRAVTRSHPACHLPQHHLPGLRSTRRRRRTRPHPLAKASIRRSMYLRCIARRTTGFSQARQAPATADRLSGPSVATRSETWTQTWKHHCWARTPNRQSHMLPGTLRPRSSPRKRRSADRTASRDQARPGERASRSESAASTPRYQADARQRNAIAVERRRRRCRGTRVRHTGYSRSTERGRNARSRG